MNDNSNAGQNPFEITVEDSVAFGELVRGWAANPDSAPKTIGDFRNQVPAAVAFLGGGFKDSDEIEYFRAPNRTKVSIVLPSPEDLAMPFAPNEPYPLPGFYAEAFGHQPNIPDMEKFRSSRIADYVMRKCV